MFKKVKDSLDGFLSGHSKFDSARVSEILWKFTEFQTI